MEMNLEVDLNHCRRLYLAALEGNWEVASEFFENDHNAFTAKIAKFSMTALHAAAYNGRTEFVMMLLDKRLPSKVLAMPDADGLTPLHYAAMAGNFRMAEALVTTDSSLTQIEDCSGFTPLLTACAVAPECEELVWYLPRKTKDDPPANPFSGRMAGLLISSLVYAGLYDIVQYLVGLYPDLTTAGLSAINCSTVSHGTTLLRAMAEAPSTFESGHPFGIWERLIYQIVPAEPIDTVSRSVKGDVEEPSQNSKSHAETSVWRRTYAPQVLRWLMSPVWEWKVIKSVRNTKSRHKLAMDLVETVCKEISKRSTVEILKYFNDHDILDTAIMNGVVEIVRVCLKYFPDSIDQTLMVYAVKHRQEKIFNLLSERTTLSKRRALSVLNERTASSERQDSSKTETGNVLIQAAKLSPQPRLTGVSGAIFQMQREMQWFKAVENMSPSLKARKFGQKPAWHTFQEEHKDLLKEGQEWMKNTSNSCMLVATLIATVVFAAAFTVPGGYVEGTDNQNMAGLAPAPAPAGGNVEKKGIPIFLKRASFFVFAVSDALALFSSITSILMFLSILTSRYAEEDFLKSLPQKLIIGLFSLLFAIGTMMVAFSAALYIMLSEEWGTVYILIVLLTLVPVMLFGTLQLRLFIQMVQSTYGKSIFRPQKPW